MFSVFVSEDTSTHGGLSWIDKIQQTVQRVLQSFNFFKTPVDLSGTLFVVMHVN